MESNSIMHKMHAPEN